MWQNAKYVMYTNTFTKILQKYYKIFAKNLGNIFKCDITNAKI